MQLIKGNFVSQKMQNYDNNRHTVRSISTVYTCIGKKKSK